MSGVKFVPDPPKRKFPVPKKRGEKFLVDIEFRNNAYIGVHNDGTKEKVHKDVGLSFIRNSSKEYIPKGHTAKEIERGHKVEDIKNVLFNFAKYSQVKLYVGRKCLVLRELADRFTESLEGDSIDRQVDQAWNDRTIHKIDFASIAKIVRIGAKNSARVLTFDGYEILISKADALAFRSGEVQRGADALAEYGLSFEKKTKKKGAKGCSTRPRTGR